MDTIKKFSKSKGFESLPRELLQSKEISLEAIGLLCNLQSYPDNWVLHKTELRKRFLNKEKVVDRIWDELVCHGYILQFRRREGKKYNYQYFFNVSKFTVEETQELLELMFKKGMILYHKGMKPKKGERVNLLDYLFLSDEDKKKLDLSFWTSQNGNLNEGDNTNDSSSSQNGKSNVDIPNTEDSRSITNKSTNKKLTNNKKDEEENNNKENRLLAEINTNDDFAATMRFILDAGIDMGVAMDIMSELLDKQHLNRPDLIVDQLRWSIQKNETEGIGDFTKYFINGLEMRENWSQTSVEFESVESYYAEFKGFEQPDIKIPMHNWVDGEEENG